MIYYLMIAAVWLIASFVVDLLLQATGLAEAYVRNRNLFWLALYAYGTPTAIAFLFSQIW